MARAWWCGCHESAAETRMTRAVDVAIIGAGPAGMFLAHMLHQQGRSVIVLELRDRDYVEGRVRAGVLEQGTVDLMVRLGVGERVQSEGLVHEGVNLVVDGAAFRIDLAERTGGSVVTIYGQQEVMHDLFEAARHDGIDVVFGAEDVSLGGIDAGTVTVRWNRAGRAEAVTCAFVAGCDGGHGVSRDAIPAALRHTYEMAYPFGWLGILAEVPPAHDELVYSRHERGFALASMRSTTRSRHYVQCAIDDPLDAWPDERVWDELCLRLGSEVGAGVVRGPAVEKSIVPLRSAVTEPMCHGRLFLAGDAAHVVPPTGAKGLNLAVSDVTFLAAALRGYFDHGSEEALKQYSSRALSRVWKAQRFSWWFTRLTHRFDDDNPYRRRLQRAELDYLRESVSQQRVFAENYVGLPLPEDLQA
jgi:p-hydroxybenzoate 3-monooxygenase